LSNLKHLIIIKIVDEWFGQLGIQSGAIYNDWSQIDLLPINAELLGSG
jgi:hypothetical protein